MSAPHFVSELAPHHLAEAARHTHALWGGERLLDDHVAHTLAQVERSSGLMRLCGLVDDDRLLTSLKRYHGRLMTPAGAVDTVGIGAVFTPEPLRGRGYAKQLLRELMAEARGAGFSAAMLYSDIAPSFYEQLGYVTLSHWLWSAAVTQLPVSNGLSHAPAGNLAPLLELYQASWSHPCLRSARDETRWRYFAWRNQAGDARLLLSQGQPVGYVLCKRFGDVLWLDDLVSLEVDKAAVWATLVELARQHGVSTVAGWLRPEHAGAPFTAVARDKCIPMLAPFDDRVDPTMPSHFAPLDHF